MIKKDQALLPIALAFSFAMMSKGCTEIDTHKIGQQEYSLSGYSKAHWNPAHASNFTPGRRGVEDIREVVIHTMEGSYQGSQRWFQDPSARVSAHYLIQSSDGEITQMVDDTDYAWHVLCLNETAIGIEHEGYVAQSSEWYTKTMYEESAKLTAWLVNQYLIPVDREHIIGHDESGCTTHGDPGAGWDWDHYMQLVAQFSKREDGAEILSLDIPSQMKAGEIKAVTLVLKNTGNYSWSQKEIFLGTQDPQDHKSEFHSTFWITDNRAAKPKTINNYPENEITFIFAVQAPDVREAQTVHETLQLTDGSGHWFGPKISWDIEVLPSDKEEEDEMPEFQEEEEDNQEEGGCSTTGSSSEGTTLFIILAFLFLRSKENKQEYI